MYIFCGKANRFLGIAQTTVDAEEEEDDE